ncbi:hypothetical protein HDV06_007019 [Boothiomyces sp. JEL0866]|nr:hypothetical protein HDV06_007019 [Boothiomyces sp. JEL0866]
MDAILPFIPKYLLVLFEDKNSDAFVYSFWASMGTFIGGIIVVALIGILGADPTAPSTSKLMGILQSISAGVMIFMTCFHLVPESNEVIGNRETMLYFFGGVIAFFALEIVVHFLLPHEHDADETHKKKHDKKHKGKQVIKNMSAKDSLDLYRTSLITFIAMALHNIPEGISVYLGALSNPKMGLQLALAILLHNIPEGMAVAIPLYASTGSIFQVLFWTLVNGLAEPFGVIGGGVLLAPYLNEFFLSRCLALVSGIMFCISINELFPVSIKYCGKTLATVSLFIGMLIGWASMEIVEEYFGGHGHDHHGHGHDTSFGKSHLKKFGN